MQDKDVWDINDTEDFQKNSADFSNLFIIFFCFQFSNIIDPNSNYVFACLYDTLQTLRFLPTGDMNFDPVKYAKKTLSHVRYACDMVSFTVFIGPKFIPPDNMFYLSLWYFCTHFVFTTIYLKSLKVFIKWYKLLDWCIVGCVSGHTISWSVVYWKWWISLSDYSNKLYDALSDESRIQTNK